MCWIESEPAGPMVRCTYTPKGELRVDSMGTPPPALRHGPVAVTEHAAYLVALDGSAIEVVDFADRTTTTFAKLPSPVLTLKVDDAILYAITGRPSRSGREVWSIDRASRVAVRLAEYKADKWISSLYTSGDLGIVGGDLFVCGDSRILRVTT